MLYSCNALYYLTVKIHNMFKGIKVWRLRAHHTDPMTCTGTWTEARGKWCPGGREWSCLTPRPGCVCCSCSFAKKIVSESWLLCAKNPQLCSSDSVTPNVCSGGRAVGYFSSGMLAEEKICSDSFVVTSLRARETKSKSPNGRERTNGKPTLGDF